VLGNVPTWVTLAQLVAAGFVGGFCVLQWVWWRGELRPAGAAWALAWSVDMTFLLLAGALYAYTEPGTLRDVLVFAHALLVGAFLVISIPATRAFGGGPRVAPWMAAVVTLLLVRAALWWTPLMPGERDEPATFSGCLLVAAAAVVVGYVVAAIGRMRLSRFGVLVVVALTESLAVFGAALFVQNSAVGPILGGLWAIPLALALEIVALRTLRRAQDRAALQHRMRDALAHISNTAWFVKDAESLLVAARDEARKVLDDEAIEGSLRPIARGRFVCELFSGDGPPDDPLRRTFVVDLAQVVSAAAERYALTQRLHDTAYADTLTRLPNRRAVEQHLTDVLDRANVERTRVSLVYCDLDAFKRVNDLHGHAAGDALLVRVADYLRSFGAHDDDVFVGRLGGDEFVLVVARAPQDAELVSLARSLREGFVDRSFDSHPARLTVGVATWVPGDIVDVDALVRHADTAMLEAKRSRAGFRVFDRALRRRVEADRHRRTELETAVENGAFVAHFQPVVDARTLEIVEVEALARWDHHGTLVLPSEWLELAEETGLIVPVGLEVLRQARRALERFQMPVAVNVAARQLAEPDALAQIEIAWGDVFWEHLTLEITESALVRTTHAIPVLSELRARGVRIAVDDFGTGYSSLARLSRLPVDVLKIDRSFVRDISTERGRGVIRAIVALAQTHGLDVVAEGVEHASDLTTLVELGVRRAQGNFLGRAQAGLPVRGPRPVIEAVRALHSVPTPSSPRDDRRAALPRRV